MNTTQNILSELVTNIDRLGTGQAQFVRSVNKYYRKNKKVSDAQFKVLKSIHESLNEKIHLENLIIE
jgi:hypothetical protein